MGLNEDRDDKTSNRRSDGHIHNTQEAQDPYKKLKSTKQSRDVVSGKRNKMADGRETPGPSIHSTEEIAKHLAYDIVYYCSNLKKLSPSSKHAETLRRTVDQLSDRHSILFASMVNKLELTEANGKETFENVVKEMFRDHRFNWGRLATVYALSGRLAKHFAEKNKVEYVDKIAEFTGAYVVTNLVNWIHEQGGWDAFDDFFMEEPDMEKKMWRGLMWTTVFGLGALATMAAVR